jgi:hypothetical protein
VAERLIEEPSAMANKIRGRLLAKSHDDPKSTKSEDDDDDSEIPLFPGTSLPNGKRRYYILRKKGTKGFLTPEEKLLYGDEPIFMQGKWCTYSLGSDWHYHTGCMVPLAEWVKSGGDALFVIGLCVVAFVKFTFLSILRYEIKEMITKIKLMQNESTHVTSLLSCLKLKQM